MTLINKDEAALEKYKSQFNRMKGIKKELEMGYDNSGNLEKLLDIGKEIGISDEDLNANMRLLEIIKKLENDNLSLTKEDLKNIKKEIKQIKKRNKKSIKKCR